MASGPASLSIQLEGVDPLLTESLSLVRDSPELVQSSRKLLKAVMDLTVWMLGAFKLEGQLRDSDLEFYLGSTSPEVRQMAQDILTSQPPLVVSQHKRTTARRPLLYDEKLGLLQNPRLQVALTGADFASLMARYGHYQTLKFVANF